MIEKKLDIFAISLCCTAACNLNCDYCYINASKKNKENAHVLQHNNIQALQDGTYLANVKKVFDKLSRTKYEEVKKLSIWGMEPTLSLPYFIEHIDDWFATFPNIEEIEYSTNGMAGIDSVIEFAKAVDRIIDHKIIYRTQFSYDGIESTNNIRHADSATIKKNIFKYMDYLNEHGPFKHMEVELYLHGVLSFEMIYKLNTPEKIYDYFKELDDYAFSLIDYNKCPSVRLIPRVSVNLEAPYDASTMDGIALANFIRNGYGINWQGLRVDDPETYAMDTIGVLSVVFDHLKIGNYADYKQVLWDAFNIKDDTPMPMKISNFCGNNRTELKVMWDGTLINCQNHMFETNPEDIPNDGTLINQIKIAKAKSDYFLNPLTASDEQINKTIWLFDMCNREGFLFTYNNLVNMMYLMAKFHQIDGSYRTDHEKLLRHAFLLASVYSCSYNNIVKTGNTLLRSTGYIRTYCNGALDLIEKYLHEKMIEDEEFRKARENGDFLFDDRLEREAQRKCD